MKMYVNIEFRCGDQVDWYCMKINWADEIEGVEYTFSDGLVKKWKRDEYTELKNAGRIEEVSKEDYDEEWESMKTRRKRRNKNKRKEKKVGKRVIKTRSKSKGKVEEEKIKKNKKRERKKERKKE